MKIESYLILLFCIPCLLLSACGGKASMADLKTELEKIKNAPGGKIEPLPQFHSYESFHYNAMNLRSPFQPPLDEVVKQGLQKHSSNTEVKPNPDRAKEYLETFSLDSLIMVGTIAWDADHLSALVKDPNDMIHRIKEGNYLGQNDGKITKISPQTIELLEIIPDGQERWIEVPRIIKLKE